MSRRLALLLVIALLAAPGCLFDTRDPESGTVAVCYEETPAINVDRVFENLDGSLECFQASTYLAQLAEDFEYIPAPGVDNLPDDWGKAQEEEFIGRLFSDAQDIQSSLRVRDVNPPEGETSVLVEAEYSVTVVVDGSPITFSGEAFYTLVEIGSFFRMTRWEEKASSSPLGLLRAGN
jgi:hypothetical protein